MRRMLDSSRIWHHNFQSEIQEKNLQTGISAKLLRKNTLEYKYIYIHLDTLSEESIEIHRI